jgi:cellobiose phosphorylase
MDPICASTNGYFDSANSEYVITDLRTPRDWYNYAWNDSIVGLFSPCGRGESLIQDDRGRRFHVASNRMLYLRDQASGEFWNLNALPVRQSTGAQCRHGLGYSEIESEVHGVSSVLRWFIPEDAPCECWQVTLTNNGSASRTLDLFAYMGTSFDGVLRPQSYYDGHGAFHSELDAVTLSKLHDFQDAKEVRIFLTMDRKVTGYDVAERGFLGSGTELFPDAVARGQCGDTESEMEKSCCALQSAVILAPGESVTICLLAGGVVDLGEVADLRARFLSPEKMSQAWQASRARILATVDDGRIETPDATLNAFFNPWLKRQLSLGARWARVRHNGFRDQIQDIGSLALFAPDEAFKQLRRVLSFQYPNGYAPRTWLDGQILDKDFSDNHVWIAAAVHSLVMEKGTCDLLETMIPYNDGSEGTLYEHVKRSVEYYDSDRGPHGLLKIRSGDWNDCLDRIGPEGKGESVWLSMAWVSACAKFADLARICGRESDAVQAEAWADAMRDLVDREAWDGDWYLRAYHDDGGAIGSAQNDKARMFLLPQAWSVYAGAARGERGAQAMDSVDRLLNSKLGTRTMLDPYNGWDDRIGLATGKTPGTHENGGVYLHACTFKLAADSLLKRHENVAFALKTILPFTEHAERQPCEPYVLCNSYFAIDDSYRYGSAGQSWGTGAAGWFYYALTHFVFGIRPQWDGLFVDPCLPPEWKQVVFHRRFRGTDYEFRFEQKKPCGSVRQILVDGHEIEGSVILSNESSHVVVDVILE